MNNEFLLKVVNYVADHFGNLPDNSKPGFENFTNDEFDTAVKYLAEIGVLKLNQSKDFSYCGRRDIETNDDYEEYYVTKAFISEENTRSPVCDLFERLRHALSVLPQSGHLANENRDGVHSR